MQGSTIGYGFLCSHIVTVIPIAEGYRVVIQQNSHFLPSSCVFSPYTKCFYRTRYDSCMCWPLCPGCLLEIQCFAPRVTIKYVYGRCSHDQALFSLCQPPAGQLLLMFPCLHRIHYITCLCNCSPSDYELEREKRVKKIDIHSKKEDTMKNE